MAISSNNDVLSSAEDAIKVAEKALGKTLDYSVNSLQDLDALIEHVKKQFATLTKEGKLTEQTIKRASISMGSYLGEVIRRNYGGTWVAKNAVMKTLVIKEFEFSPINYIFQRLIKNSEYTLGNYWTDIAHKLQPQDNLHGNKATPDVDTKNTPLVSRKKGNRDLLVIGGIAGIAILCVIGMLAVYLNIKATSEFKAKLEPFLVEAEKLNVMTDQGVNFQEFRTQLIEVKSTYAAINSWPMSYQDEQRSFDLAIKGWEYALEIWNFQLSAVGLSSFTGRPDYEGIDIYLDGIDSFANYDEEISLLMSRAGIYYEAGKAGIK